MTVAGSAGLVEVIVTGCPSWPCASQPSIATLPSPSNVSPDCRQPVCPAASEPTNLLNVRNGAACVPAWLSEPPFEAYKLQSEDPSAGGSLVGGSVAAGSLAGGSVAAGSLAGGSVAAGSLAG